MTPYYEQSGVTIYHGDCMDVLRGFPMESVDAVIADPPYGIDYQSAWRTDKANWKPKIYNDKAPFIWWMWDAFRVTADGGSVLCFCRWDTQEVFRLALDAAGYSVKSQVIWDRGSHGMGDLKASYAPQHDAIWFGVKGSYDFHGGRPASVVRAQRLSGEQLLHPNEKPVELMAQLVGTVADSSQTVLDPMMGVGSTLVGAKLRGRKAIGIEIDEANCEIAANRLRQDALPLEVA